MSCVNLFGSVRQRPGLANYMVYPYVNLNTNLLSCDNHQEESTNNRVHSGVKQNPEKITQIQVAESEIERVKGKRKIALLAEKI